MSVNSFIKALRSTAGPQVEDGVKLLDNLRANKPEIYSDLLKEMVKCLGEWSLSPSEFRLAALLIKHNPKWAEENASIARYLALAVEGGGPLAERACLAEAMALLPEKVQSLHLERCQERDNLAKLLLEWGAFGQVLSLIRASAGRWTPEGSNISDLVWLLDLLLTVRRYSAGATATVTIQTPGGPVVNKSRALLEAMVTETCYASAQAYLRCLRGPAGPEHCRLLTHFGQDPGLGIELEEVFYSDPAALALAMEEELLSNLFNQDILQKLKSSGLEAAKYCIKVLAARLSTTRQ